MAVELLPAELFSYFLVFLRVGAAMMLMPALGEASYSPRARLHVAIVVTVIVAPVVSGLLPEMPATAPMAALVIIREVLIGLMIGGVTRMLLSVMHVAGMVMAFQSSLAAAMFFDPNQGTQTGIISNFLNLVAIVLIFATDLHHMLLRGLVGSFVAFAPGSLPPVGDFAQLAAQVVSDAFRIGVQLAAPLIVVGFLIYVGAGVINRLMPRMPVFFVVLPLQVFMAFVTLMLTIGMVMLWFLRYFDDTVFTVLPPV